MTALPGCAGGAELHEIAVRHMATDAAPPIRPPLKSSASKMGSLRDLTESSIAKVSELSERSLSSLSEFSRQAAHTAATTIERFKDMGGAESRWRKLMKEAEEGPIGAEREAELKSLLADKVDEDHLHVTEPFLKACLRAKKYQVVKACQLAMQYSSFREKAGWNCPSKAVTAKALERQLRSGFNMLLPGQDTHGHVLLTKSFEQLHFKNGTLESHQRSGYYLLHRAIQMEHAQKYGIALVLDFRGFGLRHFTHFTGPDVARGVNMLQDCFPARLAVIYVLHQPALLSAIVALFMPFVNKESLGQKFILCGSNYETLHEHVPKDQLPKTFGGTADCKWDGTVDKWIAEEAAAGDSVDLVKYFDSSRSPCCGSSSHS